MRQRNTLEGSTGFIGADLGANHGCVIRGDGKIFCWGNNGDGELGFDPTSTTTQASLANSGAIATNTYPLMVTAGGHHSCVLDTSGVAKCWGLNATGQLGNGSTTSTHLPVTFDVDDEHVRAISAGDQFTCALLTNGSVWCAGYNGNGQLGIGNTDNQSGPVPVRLDESTFLSNVTQVVAGGSHACALVAGFAATDAGAAQLGGRVFCWGLAYANGTSSQSNYAVEVANLIDPMNPHLVARAIAAGNNQSCAVMSDGSARCWGNAAGSSLGNCTEGNVSASPVTVHSSCSGDAGAGALSNVVSIGMGNGHACAVRADGGMWCWGANDYGEQANGSSGSTITAVATQVTSLSPVMAALGGGADHACALTEDGIYCWGRDHLGQLGNGSTTTGTQTSPVAVPMPQNVTWVPNPPPDQINGTWVYSASTFQRGRILDVGANHACMVVPAGSHVNEGNVATDAGAAVDASTGARVACWGEGDDGRLGGGSTADQHRPRFVTTALSGAPVAVATGASHSCALTATGSVYCWGNNSNSQAGQETTAPVPTLVSGISNAVAITAGHDHTCALLANGEVRCWGWGYHLQLGTASGSNSYTPITVMENTGSTPGTVTLANPLRNVVAISAGYIHTCALQASGRVMCWGRNHRGQCGRPEVMGVNESTHWVTGARPVLVSGGAELAPTMVSVTAGNNHTCAVAFNGDSYCWGSDYRRQIVSSGGTDEETVFLRVATSMVSRRPDVLGLSAGGNSTCALHRSASSGSAYIQVSCWGANDDHQVGVEISGTTNVTVTTPVGVTLEPSGYDLGDTQTRVALGTRFGCALSFNGDVHCWGANDVGQLGRGTTSSSQFRADPVLDLH